ncbi:glycosyltransferase family 4 protein [soil metagenome]
MNALLPKFALPFRSTLRRVKAKLAGPVTTDFDISNIEAVNAEFIAHGVEPLHATETTPVRFILFLAITKRKYFPTALTDGPDGEFARWLTSQLPTMGESFRECFLNPPGEPVKRVYEVREDLREKYPFALTPHQRREYLAWLLVHGRPDLGLTYEGILWCLLEHDETPDRGLIPTYLTQPQWQSDQPAALTATGWFAFRKYLQSRYSISSRWLKRAALPPPPFPERAESSTPLGVNVIGHYRYASGLQEACVGVVNALGTQHVRVMKRDLPVHHPSDWRDRERYQGLETFDTTIYVAAVNTFPKEYFRRSGLHMRRGVKRIALWYWEVDRLPDEWNDELTWADEVWAPTSFLAETYRRHVKVPVIPMLPGVRVPSFEAKPRAYFGLPSDRFAILFSFDMGSVMDRKNPLGLIAAYKQAFHSDDRVHLCIKVSRGKYHPENLARLKAACREVGATLIDDVLVREDALTLLNTADCYASLHRAEGLGLGLAECMLLGKPVVATAYSGNLDFMTPETSYLVNATTVPIIDTPPYPAGSVWAEPDITHAASQLRRLFDDRDEAKSIALRGQDHVRTLLSVEAAGRRMAERLREIKK